MEYSVSLDLTSCPKFRLIFLTPGKEGLKSIYGVSGPEDNMTYTSGSDRIPENYYRRPTDYVLAEGTLDMILEVAAKHPVLFR
jgi:hypothetical protein